MASSVRAITYNVAATMEPVFDTDSAGKQTQRKDADGNLVFNAHAVDGSVNGVKATGVTAAQAALVGVCTAKVLSKFGQATADILHLCAKADSGLDEFSKDMSAVAKGFNDANTMVTVCKAPVSALECAFAIKTLVNEEDDKLKAGFALGSKGATAIADVTKATKVIGNKVTNLGETVTTALTWATNAFRMITGVFDIAGAAHSLKKGGLLKEEKIAAIIKIAAAIISIAFFAFLTLASLFSFGLAGTITAISLGTLFGLTMLVKGVYNCHVKRVTSNHGQRALSQPPANIARLGADLNAETTAKGVVVAAAQKSSDELATARAANAQLVEAGKVANANLVQMTSAQQVASDRATALSNENAQLKQALGRARPQRHAEPQRRAKPVAQRQPQRHAEPQLRAEPVAQTDAQTDAQPQRQPVAQTDVQPQRRPVAQSQRQPVAQPQHGAQQFALDSSDSDGDAPVGE